MKSINHKERWIIGAVFLLLTVGFSRYQIVNTINHHTDTAMMLDVIENTAQFGLPYTHVNASNYDAIFTWSQSASKVCESPLIPTSRDTPEDKLNQFNQHAYLFVYPLAALSYLVPAMTLLPILNTISFLGILLVVYVVARRLNVSAIGSGFLVVLVSSHPVWAYGFAGDYYFDRFFMSFALLYIALIHEKLTKLTPFSGFDYVFITIIGALAASTSERSLVMIAGYTFAVTILFWNQFTSPRTKGWAFIWAIFLVVAFQAYMKFFNANESTVRLIGSFGDFFNSNISAYLNQLLATFGSQPTLDHLIKFGSINVLLFGVLAIFNWRLALIAFFALMPNVFASVGGAEKTGWLTHYHSAYFPFLVFAVVAGYAKLWRIMSKYRYGKPVALGLVSVMAAGLIIMGSLGSSLAFNLEHTNFSAPVKAAKFLLHGNRSYVGSRSQALQRVADAVPAGASVTTLEDYMPGLYSGRRIFYYPMGIDIADYAVIDRVKRPNGGYYYTGAISYVGESVELDLCLTERLRTAGYDVDNPVLQGRTAILKRKH